MNTTIFSMLRRKHAQRSTEKSNCKQFIEIFDSFGPYSNWWIEVFSASLHVSAVAANCQVIKDFVSGSLPCRIIYHFHGAGSRFQLCQGLNPDSTPNYIFVDSKSAKNLMDFKDWTWFERFSQMILFLVFRGLSFFTKFSDLHSGVKD